MHPSFIAIADRGQSNHEMSFHCRGSNKKSGERNQAFGKGEHVTVKTSISF